jgi:2-aminoadipate transaminase
LNYRFTAFEPAMQRFLESRGVVLTEDTGIHATSGGMDAITLGVRALIEPGDIVIAEAPGFTGTLSVLQQAGAKIVQIPCGMEGMEPADLERAIQAYQAQGQQKVKLIAVMPDHQNPTGAVMPLDSREAIGKLLQRYNICALEDGAYSELRAEGDALPPLQSFAPEQVLYATSFSKILWPGIRIGALVAHKEITTATAKMHFNDKMVVATTNAAMAERFIANDAIRDSRLEELRTVYRERRDAMLAALEEYFSRDNGYAWERPNGGMFLWLTGPKDVDFTALYPEALKNGVAYVPGSTCAAPGNEIAHNTARLNFASSSPDKIREGIRRLAITALRP